MIREFIMKVVILAGGLGTRISEESHLRPKPMIEIGGKPILWHIMKIYSHYGLNDFIICCGYKGNLIKEYFANYSLYNSNVTIDLVNNDLKVHQNKSEPWKVTLVDTGEQTMTGGRIKRICDFLDQDDFCLTYGDGVADINISELLAFHKNHKKMATITAAQPPGRFGALDIGENNRVHSFREKPHGDGHWINGGFFVLNQKVIDLIDNDSTIWEQGPLESLSKSGELNAYKLSGFWQPMDTMRDKNYLEELWSKGKAPWRKW